MIDKIRFSSSFIIAMIFTFICFLGMSFLISSPKQQKVNSVEMVNFSRINDMKSPDIVKKPKVFEKPVREVVKQPPATPKLDITSYPNDRTHFPVPEGFAKVNLPDIVISDLPNLSKPGPNNNDGSDNQNLVELFAIQPVYPPVAARNKTEGWVKVEFIVNEFGKVTKARVVDAKPKRVFDAATLKAIYKSKFKPTIVENKAVSQTATKTYEFKLEK